MYTQQMHRHIQTHRGISYNRAPHIWHESHPATVLHLPSSSRFPLRRLDEPTCEFIYLSQGSGLLLIHKMTLMWSLFSLCRDPSIHSIARNAFKFVVSSVNPLPAFGSSTEASNLVLTRHSVKLVVETKLGNRERESSVSEHRHRLSCWQDSNQSFK